MTQRRAPPEAAPAPQGATLDPGILAQAVEWLALMQETRLDAAQQADFAQWQARSDEHRRAWRRAERLLEKLAVLPPGVARQVLVRPGTARRTALRSLAGLALLLAPTGRLVSGPDWLDRLRADHVTAIGEQARLALDDGSTVALNTRTALDLRFDGRQRLLHLLHGEIYVVTAADPHQPPRPFLVETALASAWALGTRFSVRQEDRHAEFAVYEGGLLLHATGQAPLRLQAGQSLRITADGPGRARPVSEAVATAWRQGLLVADEMPLAQWVGELQRHSGRPIGYEGALAALPVSGAFPLADPAQALRMLARTRRVVVDEQALWIGSASP